MTNIFESVFSKHYFIIRNQKSVMDKSKNLKIIRLSTHEIDKFPIVNYKPYYTSFINQKPVIYYVKLTCKSVLKNSFSYLQYLLLTDATCNILKHQVTLQCTADYSCKNFLNVDKFIWNSARGRWVRCRLCA